MPGLVEQFKPRVKYLLVDENDYTDGELAPLKNLVAAIFRIEHPADPQNIQALLGLLDDWLIAASSLVKPPAPHQGRTGLQGRLTEKAAPW